MWHRHLTSGSDETVVEVEDILERGTVKDWRELAAKVRRDPWGRAAQSVEKALAHNGWYGTTTIWSRFLARCRTDHSASDGR